jgi:hypothetical protein
MSPASTGSLLAWVPLDLDIPKYIGQPDSPAPSIYNVWLLFDDRTITLPLTVLSPKILIGVSDTSGSQIIL